MTSLNCIYCICYYYYYRQHRIPFFPDPFNLCSDSLLSATLFNGDLYFSLFSFRSFLFCSKILKICHHTNYYYFMNISNSWLLRFENQEFDILILLHFLLIITFKYYWKSSYFFLLIIIIISFFFYPNYLGTKKKKRGYFFFNNL